LLIHLETNRIYELNQTAARLWEIINDNGAPADMLAEFDVAEDRLSKEIESLVSMLKKEDLVIEQDQH
ncbi:MAG TPA: PqqD family protein, partial [Blastocatellia bacterium]|nr:PqqD family protein [Blastocatellia bacterium]